jgi:hypothetical protein
MYRQEAVNAVSVNDKIEAVRSDGASLHRVITRFAKSATAARQLTNRSAPSSELREASKDGWTVGNSELASLR